MLVVPPVCLLQYWMCRHWYLPGAATATAAGSTLPRSRAASFHKPGWKDKINSLGHLLRESDVSLVV